MKLNVEYTEARDLLLSLVKPVGTEKVLLEKAGGRVLAEELSAAENVPAFDRSPYDGYAFRAIDSEGASRENPVTLRIIEEIPAGAVPTKTVGKGEAVKILTGAPIPEGADAVVMYEKTCFTENEVTLFSVSESGSNIVWTGEDIKKGELLAPAGTVIDPGLAGTLAAQGVGEPPVFRKPRAAFISTGSELVDALGEVPEGKIRDSNRYTFTAALEKDGTEVTYLGTAGDSVEQIEALISKGLRECDMVVLTGGVSAGDYDLTPDAMKKAGCEMLIKGVEIKPGMACCFGIKDGKPVFALSGNPSSSLTNYVTVVRPAVRKMTGLRDYMPEEITVTLSEGFKKKTKGTRILKGCLKIENGRAVMHIPKGQGNVMISSSIGCDIYAVVPSGSGPLDAGTELKGYMV